MTKLEKLLDKIVDSDITLVQDMEGVIPAASMHGRYNDFIFFNEHAFETEAERYVALMHEKGHCDSGEMYSIHTPFRIREKCEYQAWCRAIEDNLPYEKIMDAMGVCMTSDGANTYEVAEYLDITVEFLERAVAYYQTKGKKFF